MADAYPLQWPQGWMRTKMQRSSRENQNDLSRRDGGVMTELKCGVTWGNPHIHAGKHHCTQLLNEHSGSHTCDQCDAELSLDAVHIAAPALPAVEPDDKDAIIEAMRGIERWGAGEMMDRAFSGFKGLPAQASEGEDCWKVLGLHPMSPSNLVILVHRDLTRKLHAKQSASEEFSRINVARDDALRALKASETTGGQ